MPRPRPAAGRAARSRSLSVLVVVLALTAYPSFVSVSPAQQQEEAWITDVPTADLSGTWVFDAATSDPMLESWRGQRIVYEITQHPAVIVLEFRTDGGHSNRQTYSWNGEVHTFERGGRTVEEEARWTDAGRVLEVRGRHWSPDRPGEVTTFGFRYEMRGNVLSFTQRDESGETVWRFVRSQG